MYLILWWQVQWDALKQPDPWCLWTHVEQLKETWVLLFPLNWQLNQRKPRFTTTTLCSLTQHLRSSLGLDCLQVNLASSDCGSRSGAPAGPTSANETLGTYNLLDPGMEPGSPAVQADFLPTELLGKLLIQWTLKVWALTFSQTQCYLMPMYLGPVLLDLGSQHAPACPTYRWQSSCCEISLESLEKMTDSLNVQTPPPSYEDNRESGKHDYQGNRVSFQ